MHKTSPFSFFQNLSRREQLSRLAFLTLILTLLISASISVFSAYSWSGKHFAGFFFNERMVVSGTGQYHWTGTQAGLKFPDKILSADGKPIQNLRDLDEIIKSKNVGDLVAYSVERRGSIILLLLL